MAVPPGGKDLASNWACHARGLAGVSNTILLVYSSDEVLADQLVVMGYAVHIVEGQGLTVPASEGRREWKVWRRAHVELLAAALSKGLSVLLGSVEAVWTADATRVAAAQLPAEYHVGVATQRQGREQSAAFFVRSSDQTVGWATKLAGAWDDSFLKEWEDGDKNDGANGLRVTDLRIVTEFEPGSTASYSSLPIIAPPAFDGRTSVEWLKAKQLWIVNDFDLGCTIAHCVRS